MDHISNSHQNTEEKNKFLQEQTAVKINELLIKYAYISLAETSENIIKRTYYYSQSTVDNFSQNFPIGILILPQK